MKNIKKIIGIAMAFTLLFSAFGCSVNEEKLANKAVAKVGDTEIPKKNLDAVVGFTLVSYYANSGTEISMEDSSVSSLKEEVANNLVEYELVKKAAKDYGYIKNDKEVKGAAKETLKSIKSSSYLKGDKYKSVLKQYGFEDEKSFENAVNLYAEFSTYTSGFAEKFRNKVQGGKYATANYMTVDDIKVPAYIYYYCYIQKAMEQEYNEYQKQYSGSADSYESEQKTDEQKQQELKESTLAMVKEKAAFYAAGKEAKTKIDTKKISSKKAENESLSSMFGSDTLTSVYNAYGITKKQYDEAGKWIATADLYKEALEEKVAYDKPTEKDAEKEFNKNTKAYDKSTVSAKHILTSDKSLAKEIYEQATQKGADFDQIMSKYQKNSAVQEASDLGAFTYPSMVEDFSKAAFDAEKGSVVGPVKTEYGYHVIYVYDKNTVEPKFEDSKDTILSKLDSQNKLEAVNKLDEDIKDKHNGKVEIEDIDEPYNMLLAELKKDNKVKIYKSVLNK